MARKFAKTWQVTRQETMQERDQKLFLTACEKVARNKTRMYARKVARY